MPEVYHSLGEVFSKQQALLLPPHRPYDCAINLIPGAAFPKGRLYSISRPEREAMEAYIKDSLAAGFIRPSSSPLGAGFFFVGKKDGSLRPCKIPWRQASFVPRHPPWVQDSFLLVKRMGPCGLVSITGG